MLSVYRKHSVYMLSVYRVHSVHAISLITISHNELIKDSSCIFCPNVIAAVPDNYNITARTHPPVTERQSYYYHTQYSERILGAEVWIEPCGCEESSGAGYSGCSSGCAEAMIKTVPSRRRAERANTTDAMVAYFGLITYIV